jgi:chorismate mutase
LISDFSHVFIIFGHPKQGINETTIKGMELNLLKTPGECLRKEEVRDEIDRIDRAIIELFALRFEYVKAIVQFKADRHEVVAQDRKDRVINQRAQWATELGLDTETFANLYRLLIDSNIQKEMELLEKAKKA